MPTHREAVTFLTLILEDFSYVFHTMRLLMIEYNSCDIAGRVLDHEMCPAIHVADMMAEHPLQGACSCSPVDLWGEH